jgi:UDPglucose 6-dehydrogenase
LKVTVFGIGYVSPGQAAILVEVGHDVVCVDFDVSRVEALKQGRIPIYEPGLEPQVKENFAAGRLNFTIGVALGVKHGEAQFIAVGTPPDEEALPT